MLRLTLLLSVIAIAYGSSLRPIPRIIGGSVARIEDAPYHAAILVAWTPTGSFVFGCSGAILSDTVVLTIAQCIVTNPSKMMVRIGSADYERGGQTVDVARAVEHEIFGSKLDYDVGILFMANYLLLDGIRTAKIPLPTQDQNIAAGVNALSTGFGRLTENGDDQKILHRVTIPVVEHSVCEALYASQHVVTPRMMCAGNFAAGGQGPCGSDIGGPLVANGVLVGLYSFSYRCAIPNFPAVFLNVPTVVNWIKDMMTRPVILDIKV